MQSVHVYSFLQRIQTLPAGIIWTDVYPLVLQLAMVRKDPDDCQTSYPIFGGSRDHGACWAIEDIVPRLE